MYNTGSWFSFEYCSVRYRTYLSCHFVDSVKHFSCNPFIGNILKFFVSSWMQNYLLSFPIQSMKNYKFCQQPHHISLQACTYSTLRPYVQSRQFFFVFVFFWNDDKKFFCFLFLGSSADRRHCRHCWSRDCSNKLQVSPSHQAPD